MLWIWLAGILGIFRFRGRAYWKWVIIFAVWLIALQSLFYAGGTLQNPQGDGYITRYIRIATQDGPGMGIFAIGFLILYWGGIVFIVRKLWQNGKAVEAERYTQEWDTGERVPLGRKLAEAAGLTLVAAGWLYFSMVKPYLDAQANRSVRPTVQVPAPSIEGADDPVAREVADLAASIKPQKIDPVTNLTGATSEKRVLIYHYDIIRRDASDDDLREFIRDNAVKKACQSTGMLSAMKDYGITYRYSYTLPNAEKTLEIDATYDECKRLKFAT